MSKPRYRLDPELVRDLSVACAHAVNGDEIGLSGRRLVICRTLRGEVTDRQLECLHLYYTRGLNQEAIAKVLRIGSSTVNRNMAAGLAHVNRALGYIAEGTI